MLDTEILMTLRVLIPSRTLFPTPLLAFLLLPLHLLCPSPRAFPKCHQTAQFIKQFQSYHKFSPGNFHKLEIGAISLSVESLQSSLYSVHHLGVIKWGQQGAVWAHLSHVLCRVYTQREGSGRVVILHSIHPSFAYLERAKTGSKWL